MDIIKLICQYRERIMLMGGYTFMDFIISLNKAITSYKIYNEILPKIIDLYSNKSNLLELDTVQIDLYEIDDISSMAIPLLISIAERLKKDFKNLTLILPYKIKPKSILYLYGFTKNATLRELFSLNEDDIGDTDSDIVYTNSRLEIFDYYNEKKEIVENDVNNFFNNQARLGNTNGLIRFLQNNILETKHFFKSSSYNKEEEDIQWILKSVFFSIYKVAIEFIVNACYHGQTKCYFMYNYDEEYNTVLISIADTGKGLRESLDIKNNSELNFINKDTYSNYDKDLLCIIEAISYRYNKKGFGIYDVAQIITSLGGTIRYHYNTTQCLFTYDLFKKIKYKDDFRKLINIYQKELDNKNKSDKYKQARKTEEFKGVHVEIQLQLNKYDWRIFKDVSSKYFNNQK